MRLNQIATYFPKYCFTPALCFVLIVPWTSYAFERTHLDITHSGLGRIQSPISGKLLRFDEKALDQINDTHSDMDSFRDGDIFNPILHFDDEKFNESRERLLDLKINVRKK